MKLVRCDVSFSRSWLCSCRSRFSTIYAHCQIWERRRHQIHSWRQQFWNILHLWNVSSSPLNNDGFRSTRKNLTERFENKRYQVSYLKSLFNVQRIVQESGASLKELQSTIQGFLTSFQFSGVNIENWDPIVAYMCSPSNYRSNPYKIKTKLLLGSSLIPFWLSAVEHVHGSVERQFSLNVYISCAGTALHSPSPYIP